MAETRRGLPIRGRINACRNYKSKNKSRQKMTAKSLTAPTRGGSVAFNFGRRGVVLLEVSAMFDADFNDAHRVARAQISNDRLIRMARRNRPPQSWYERDEEDLF